MTIYSKWSRFSACTKTFRGIYPPCASSSHFNPHNLLFMAIIDSTPLCPCLHYTPGYTYMHFITAPAIILPYLHTECCLYGNSLPLHRQNYHTFNYANIGLRRCRQCAQFLFCFMLWKSGFKRIPNPEYITGLLGTWWHLGFCSWHGMTPACINVRLGCKKCKAPNAADSPCKMHTHKNQAGLL